MGEPHFFQEKMEKSDLAGSESSTELSALALSASSQHQ